MADAPHHQVGEAPRQSGLAAHQPEADGAEQEPRRRITESRERRVELGDAEHPEQETAEDARDAVVEDLRHPRGDHEEPDRQRAVGLGIDAQRQQPETGCRRGNDDEEQERPPIGG